MLNGFSESVRQSKFSAYVDTKIRYLRKYWNTKRETITVRVISTEVKNTNTNKFRNEIRAFLYTTPENLLDLISDIKLEYESIKCKVEMLAAEELEIPDQLYNDYKLNFRISVAVRGYEKEFFFLKVLQLQEKPQLILRALAKLSRERNIDEVFTAPEYLFSLLHILDIKEPVFKKNIRFNY